jgi:hypothetical protein
VQYTTQWENFAIGQSTGRERSRPELVPCAMGAPGRRNAPFRRQRSQRRVRNAHRSTLRHTVSP